VKRLILLADDSPTIQRLVAQMFVGGDFDVVSVSNGDAAVRKFEEVRPDLVLADIYMPGKNGYEVCAAVKQHSELADTPVVLLAGAFDAFDEAKAKEVGAAAHITKPFEPQALIGLVSSLAPKGTGRTRPEGVVPVVEHKAAPTPAPIEMPRQPAPTPAAEPPPAIERPSPVLTMIPTAEAKIPAPQPTPQPVAATAPITSAAAPLTLENRASEKTVPEKAAPADSGDLLGLQDLFKPAPTSVSDAEIDRIADRVIQKLSTQVIENVAWDVVPDITTKVLKEELKRQS